MSRSRGLLALTLLPALLAAQSPASIRRAAAAVTPGDVVRHIGVLAADSMLGRATPSPQLEQAARYIARQFRSLGLRPAGDSGTFIQHYPIQRRQIDTARTTLTIAAARGVTTLKAGSQVNLVQLAGPLPPLQRSGPVVLLTGTPDPARRLAGADVRMAWLALIATADAAGIRVDGRLVGEALRAGALGIVLISDRSDAQWRDRMREVTRPAYTVGGAAAGPGGGAPGPVVVEIRDAAAAAALGIDPARLRAQVAPAARRLGGVTLTLRVRQLALGPTRAPNVIALLEGSDPRLKHEYVFFTGHMDHIGTPGAGEGCVARGGDSICNGADDDASGATAVMELARAFSALTPRPRRSLVFMTVSGEERGLWGSGYFTGHPTVPLRDAVADLNTDMVGRNWKDTIAVIGREHSDLGATLDRVAAAHPELHMRPIGDRWPEEQFYFRSDHYNFARRGVPILFFFNGVHPDYHQVSDEVAQIDGEKESRIIKLVFFLGLEIADRTARPQWNPDSYRRIVQGGN